MWHAQWVTTMLDLNWTWKREISQLLINLFNLTDISKEFHVVYNKDDGLVDWTGVMKSLNEDCVKEGGRFRNNCVIQMNVGTSGKNQCRCYCNKLYSYNGYWRYSCRWALDHATIGSLIHSTAPNRKGTNSHQNIRFFSGIDFWTVEKLQ